MIYELYSEARGETRTHKTTMHEGARAMARQCARATKGDVRLTPLAEDGTLNIGAEEWFLYEEVK